MQIEACVESIFLLIFGETLPSAVTFLCGFGVNLAFSFSNFNWFLGGEIFNVALIVGQGVHPSSSEIHCFTNTVSHTHEVKRCFV